MPNRWLKADILTSDRFNSVSLAAQSVYVRLLVVTDDHGRYDGRTSVLLSACDPLQTFARICKQVSADDVQIWFTHILHELEEVDLLRFWMSGKGLMMLIPRFYERPRSKSKFPEPPPEVIAEQGCTHLFADVFKCPLPTFTTSTTTTVHDHDHGSRSAPRNPGAAKKKLPAATAETWQAYAVAYEARYKTTPLRNAATNSQMARFVSLVGVEDAPHIAAFYLGHNKGFYVSKHHAVGLLVTDAEALRTQWKSGNRVTETAARQADRTQSNFDSFAPLIAEAEERERKANAEQ